MTPQLARARSPEPRPRLRDDLAWGARQGAFYAAAFSALGVLGYCLGDGGFRDELRVKALGCVAVYWFTGAIGGLLIGAFRSRLGQLGVALAVGAGVGVCFAMACVVLGEGPRALADRRMWAAGGCTGVFLGVLCVALSWNRWRAANTESFGHADHGHAVEGRGAKGLRRARGGCPTRSGPRSNRSCRPARRTRSGATTRG